ncbi:MAG: ABC transporter ATP-binding protein [Lachnospiraceae bacterium]
MDMYQVRNLTFGYYPYEETEEAYAAEAVEVLHDISFTVKENSFVLLCGATGCGKSTLLRLLKKELQPAGKTEGEILLQGKPFEEWDDRDSAKTVGFVMQNPDDQCVTDKVWHELAFGLENMGVPSSDIRRRVAEISAYFGIDDWYDKRVEELSGGQKQILNLAAVMVMNPQVLLLDEPTAQLDPIATGNFLEILKKLNKELGVTVILAEHRLEETFVMADQVLVMENGRLMMAKTPKEAAAAITKDLSIYQAMPEAVRLFHVLNDLHGSSGFDERGRSRYDSTECPLTVGEGRGFLKKYLGCAPSTPDMQNRLVDDNRVKIPALELRNVWFRYAKKRENVLRGISLSLYEGEILCLLGSNGSGKTTLFKVISGIESMQEGTLRIWGHKAASGTASQIGYLPQDVETLFVADTVERELALVGEKTDERICKTTHPYDLSGGEKQLLGIRKVLAGGKKILLLDEPTKGLDAAAKREFCHEILKEKEKGVAILLITHDPEFAASCADRCGLFFRGEIVSLEKMREFFQENRFYTTAAARIAKGYANHVVTSEDLYECCKADTDKTE